MLHKRNLIVAAVAAALILAASVGAQIGPIGSPVIDLLTGNPEGGWVKFDKNPATDDYTKVYCIKFDGGLSCHWDDVRQVYLP
jgi:hypothetical protein